VSVLAAILANWDFVGLSRDSPSVAEKVRGKAISNPESLHTHLQELDPEVLNTRWLYAGLS
jgi:hypothetical protein